MERSPIDYPKWMVYGGPISFLLFSFIVFWMQLFYLGPRYLLRCNKQDTQSSAQTENVKVLLRKEKEKLGKLNFSQWVTFLAFILQVFLWFFRDPGFIRGWSSFFPEHNYISDTIPAVFVAFLLFFIPSDIYSTSTEPILNWETVNRKLPWFMIIMLGGGYALAKACQASGLAAWVGDSLMVFNALPTWIMMFLICLLLSFLTELQSNSATTTLFMPIMAAMGEELGMSPLYLMWPVTMACEFAFMLPTSASSTALAMTTGRVKIPDMVKAGFVINLFGTVIVVLVTHVPWIMDFFALEQTPWMSDTNVTDISSARNVSSLEF